MEKQVTFHDLATHLRMLLESESYSQTTVKDMDFILNSFASYMDKNGLVVYSPEIGERLIQYCEVELKVCASRVTRARVIVHALSHLKSLIFVRFVFIRYALLSLASVREVKKGASQPL